MKKSGVRVLLIEDDEDDYLIIENMLAGISFSRVDLHWAGSYESALDKIQMEHFDVVLLDYLLGARTGLDFLREVNGKGISTPVILLTGQGGFEVDVKALEAGAADYLVKSEISAATLDRAIRYSIEQKLTERELKKANEMLRAEIEERRKAERALRLNESRLETLLALSQMTHATAEQIADFVLEEQVRLTGSKVGWLGFMNEDQTRIALHAWSKEVMKQCRVVGEKMHFSVDAAGIWADVVRERKTLVINDYSAPNLHKLGYPEGHVPLRRLLVSPVFEDDRIVAVATVANKDEDYDATDIRQHALLLDGMWKLIQRDRAVKKLLESESLAAMGRALSGVAHEMKTPLIAIGGFVRLAQKHMDEATPHRRNLDIVIDETRRLEAMVQDMLDFSRPLALDRSSGKVEEILGESLILLDSMARERELSLRSATEPDLPRASFDRLRMKQVLVNLAANAIQASPEGEAVTIRVYARQADLIIDVIDPGPGIPLENRGDVFSPFFTTKKEGTGLGLSIVKKIVEAHRGRISILDNPDRGITFRVVLPDCLERTNAERQVSVDRTSNPGTHRVCYGARIEECTT
jgi:signal transduction histidine kinase/DNA-binding response OmpR family regulator